MIHAEFLLSMVLFSQESLSSKFRPMEELKKDMAELDLLVETDLQVSEPHSVCVVSPCSHSDATVC